MDGFVRFINILFTLWFERFMGFGSNVVCLHENSIQTGYLRFNLVGNRTSSTGVQTSPSNVPSANSPIPYVIHISYVPIVFYIVIL